VLKTHTRTASFVEQYGIDAVPKSARTKTWLDVLVIYAGLNISIAALIFGGILVPGLSWTDALGVVVIGNVIAALLMVLTGHMGVDHGTPASVLGRQHFGHPFGSNLNSLAVIICVTGWFAVQNEIAGLALDKAAQSVFGFSSPLLMIFLLGATNVLVSMTGIESIKWLSRLSVPLLTAVLLWAWLALIDQYEFADLIDYEPTGSLTYLQGIDWMIGGWIVGVHIAPDVARHVKGRGHNWVGTLLGVAPLAMFTSLLGALSSLATGNWNPVEGIAALGLGLPAMLVIMFSTWTTNDVNLYNAGLALTNVLPALSRWKNTLILGTAGTVLSMLRITEHFTALLELMVYLFVPLVGVSLVDYYLLRRCRLDQRLSAQGGADTIYAGGINPVAWAVVVLTAALALLIPRNLPASLIALVLSGGLYFAAMRWRYGQELPGTSAFAAETENPG